MATHININKKAHNTMPTNTIVAKFDKLENELNARTIEREPFNRNMILALLSGRHYLALGEPGLAKSLAIDLMSKAIDMPRERYFRYQLSPFTTPDQLLGGIDLDALEKGVVRYNLTDKMAEAKIVLLDELFRANNAVLNSMLEFLNEAEITNGTERVGVDRWCVFGATNSFPDDAELSALADRILIRDLWQRIRTPGNFDKMLDLNTDPIEPFITPEEVDQAQAEVRAVVVNEGARQAVVTLREDLSQEGIYPSDRRYREALTVVRAHAWLNGRDEAGMSDLTPLASVLWMEPGQIDLVRRIVVDISSPAEKAGMELLAQLRNTQAELSEAAKDYDESQTRRSAIVQLWNKVQAAADDLKKLRAEYPASCASFDECEAAINNMKTVFKKAIKV